jgi:hypothetical protein
MKTNNRSQLFAALPRRGKQRGELQTIETYYYIHSVIHFLYFFNRVATH